MPATFSSSSKGGSQLFALLRQSSPCRVSLILLVAWVLLLPRITSAQVNQPKANLGEAAPIEEEDLARPAAPPAAELNPAVEIEPDEAKPQKGYLIPTEPIELFLAGGFSMWPLLVASMISLWFVLERMVVLRRRRVIPRAFADRFIQHLEQGKLNAETALRLCEENQSPIAEIFAHGIRKWGRPSAEVEQAVMDGGERQIAKLRLHLRIINGVYTVSPLLGLLGTVVGMIISFNELAQGGDTDRMQRLAGGVGIALITTASGLAVAIPSMVMFTFLSGRVEALVIEMDTLSQKMVDLISAEGLASRPRQVATKAATTAAPALPASKPKTVGT